MASQICPAHRARHADVREKQPDVRVGLAQPEGFVGIAGLEHTVPGIQEHVGRPHALEDIVFDDQNCGVGGAFGH